ncbi:hypothetical protein [Chromobacterium haemolyticum]|uniref:hypothetical protein n=1 Tax=Chromobacterium haemolyticum TaxID=394935 RepID=UPI00244C42D7|nr:hypothetical protein [Chromobacterium haemolyticum]MDH0342129.1 hypothetical protein [Chromobacterium haemolyticum]
MSKPNIKKLQKQCDDFNAVCKNGGRIMFKRDGVDEPYEARTRSEAYILSGHSAVVFVEGVSGCYQLSHCEPITENQPPAESAMVLKARLSRMHA